MLTLKECRELLHELGKDYTDEELKAMLGFLSSIASTVVTDLKRKRDEKASSIDVAGIE
jgi:hypothetical protein